MAVMKLLLCCYHNPNFRSLTEGMENGIRQLGHTLVSFDDRQHVIPGRIRKKIPWLHYVDLWFINKKFLSIARREKPDAAIVTGGHRITASTIRTLNREGIHTVLWTIDPPTNFAPILKAAPYYKRRFCQGSEAIELLGRIGLNDAQLLPMAYDPDMHKPVILTDDEKKRYGNDVVFVGSYYPNRGELFSALADFDLGIWGPGWDAVQETSRLRTCIRGGSVTPEEFVKIYCASKIVVVCHYQDGTTPCYQTSPKVFEIMACGTFLLVDNQRDVFALFEEGRHCATFSNTADLIQKATYYLSHDAERLRIAGCGREETLAKHSYAHRIQKIIGSL
jgi:spore maturation protein CgeB